MVQRNSSSSAQKINCGKVYKNKQHLRQHMKECGQIFACDNPGCSKPFNTESDLSQHLRVCGGDPCPCGYEAQILYNFVEHHTRCKVNFFLTFLFLSFKPQKINCLFTNPLFSTSPVSLRRTRSPYLQQREKAICQQCRSSWRGDPT